MDPIQFAARDTDLYRFVRNNPTNFTDPTGLCADEKKENKDKCNKEFEDKINKGLEIFKKCKAASDKLKDCQEKLKTTIEVKCKDNPERSDSFWQSPSTIYINPNEKYYKDRAPEFIAGLILFEVLNACRDDEFKKIDNDCAAGKLSLDAYLKATEKVEYDSAIEHIRIATQCVNNGDWLDKANFLKAWWGVPFDKFYEQNHKAGHTNSYSQFWKDNCEKAFNKNPKIEKK
jgi:hypothetical protein